MLATEFTKVKNRLENDDRAGVIELIESVTDAIDARRAREEALQRLVRQVKANATRDSGARQAANEFVEATVTAETQRAQTLQTLLQYIGQNTTASDALDVVTTSIDAEETAHAKTENLRESSSAADVSLPPILALRGDETLEVPLGTTQTTSYTVENLGGATAETVSLSVDADVTASLQSNTVTDLGSSENQTFTLDASADETGQFRLTLKATTDQDTASHQTTLVVADKLAYLDAAQQQIDTLIQTVEELQQQSGASPSNNQNKDQNHSQGQNHGQNHNQGQNKGQNHNQGQNHGQNHSQGQNKGQNHNQGQNHGQGQNKGQNHGQGQNKGQNHGQGQNKGQNHGQGGGLAGVLGKLQSVEQRLKQLQTQLDRGNSGNGNSTNNKIDATTNTLGAVLNQTDALEGTHLSASDATLIMRDTEQAIITLRTAKQASVE